MAESRKTDKNVGEMRKGQGTRKEEMRIGRRRG